MQLTDEQLADVKDNFLSQNKGVREWMTDNDLKVTDIRPREVIVQLKAKYGDEPIMTLMQGMRQTNFGKQFSMMASRMCGRPGLTVEQCDMMLAKLQDAIITVNAKKVELQG